MPFSDAVCVGSPAIIKLFTKKVNKQVNSDLISWTTPTCFSTFYQCAMVPTVVENSKFFHVLVHYSVCLKGHNIIQKIKRLCYVYKC